MSYSPVECDEIHGTYSEDISLSSHTASVQLRVPWGNRYLLVNDLLLNRRRWPTNFGLIANSCAITPFPSQGSTGGGQVINYNDFAIVSVNYGAAGSDNTPDDPVDLVSEELEPTAEFQTLDYRKFVWLTAGGDRIRPLKEDEAPGRLLRGLNLVRTLYNRSAVPASVLTLPGTCNDRKYTSRLLGIEFDKETLLFTPPRQSRTVTTDGVGKWTLQTRFQINPNGWNRTWFPDEGRYAQIGILDEANGNHTPYDNHPTADFRDWVF